MTDETTSPQWGTGTKLIVALVALIIVALLVWQFKSFIGPVIFAFLLSYLLHPLAGVMSRKNHPSWRVSVTIIYLAIFLVLIGLATWGGISLVQPLQSLVNFLQSMLKDIPGFITSLTSQPIIIGSFAIDLSKFNNANLWTELQGVLSPALTKLGTLLGDIAAGAANIVTKTIFSILISYFITVESTGVRSELIRIRVPRYQEDIDRFSKYFSRIWNSYFRGQLAVFLITVIFYTILLSALGVNYALALAILAGFARFVPYVGPFVAWTTYGLVCLFQGTTIFGLTPFAYALIVIGCALVTDVIMDNFVSPRIMSDALGIHPALVLISVLVAAKLLGIVGVLIAAPTVASLQLLFTYIFRKMTDQDPWKNIKTIAAPVPIRVVFGRYLTRIGDFFKKVGIFFANLFKPKKKESSQEIQKEK
jgi:predicted PurR-regulated permease PerM